MRKQVRTSNLKRSLFFLLFLLAAQSVFAIEEISLPPQLGYVLSANFIIYPVHTVEFWFPGRELGIAYSNFHNEGFKNDPGLFQRPYFYENISILKVFKREKNLTYYWGLGASLNKSISKVFTGSPATEETKQEPTAVLGAILDKGNGFNFRVELSYPYAVGVGIGYDLSL